MTASVGDNIGSCILLDIEGTTTPVDFVYEVLFPYARARVKDYLARRFDSEDVRSDIALLREEHAGDVRKGLAPPSLSDESDEALIDSITSYIHWLMDRDRKSTPSKSLQGKIWEDGYRTGELKGQVFADVPAAFEEWRRQGKQICIYSSGSVLAQKLLFAHTESGDLTGYIAEYFDTNIGAKKESKSYRRIAYTLQRPPSEILFISDVPDELDAARTAGLETALSLRPGNRPLPSPTDHRLIHTFDELL
ncbi:MAG: acireductone synthase [Blastocatellia bacterium]|nr:acireductone synthase [Blastocatellia bacterium]